MRTVCRCERSGGHRQLRFHSHPPREPEANDFSACIRTYPQRLIASATYVECSLVLSRWQDSRVELDNWLSREDVAVASIDEAHAQLAADAFTRFGKGRHPAGLNFGDCFSYALAKSLGAPLLFKGDDFAKTDIAAAI